MSDDSSGAIQELRTRLAAETQVTRMAMARLKAEIDALRGALIAKGVLTDEEIDAARGPAEEHVAALLTHWAAVTDQAIASIVSTPPRS